MSEIRVLPRHLVNKIAAGEVIERPASVVKELVENALDAGATAIDVAVEDGGKRLISVRDNGQGMGAGDLAMAFAAHATSKIADEDDLWKIHTMGFRGEALASIASVSHASILSRQRASADAAGYEISADGGTLSPVRPASAAVGTTLTVRDLFFNTPARRKFLKAAATEFGHISEQLARLALPHHQVAFTLSHNGRVTHRLAAAADLRRRTSDFFGEELGAACIAFDSQEVGLCVWGLLAPPSQSRATAGWQYFFVNGRYVRDRSLSHALRESYRGMIDSGRQPAAFVFLQIDPGEIDVNVHPAKIEVRFRNGQMVHSQLLGAMREALQGSGSAPAVSLSADEPVADDARRQSLKQALADFFKSSRPPQRPLGFPDSVDDRPFDPRKQLPIANCPLPIEQKHPATAAPGAEPCSAAAPGCASPATSPSPYPLPSRERGEEAAVAPALGSTGFQPVPLGEGTGYKPVLPDLALPAVVPAFGGMGLLPSSSMQVHNSYIVTATDTGLAIIDQHAQHEPILFDELRARLATGNLPGQGLLIPEVIRVTDREQAVLAEHADLLDKLGIEVSQFGPGSVGVQRFTAMLAQKKVAPAEVIRDLLDVLGEQAVGGSDELLWQVLSTIACKAAVKAGDPLTPEEIDALLARKRAIDPQTCPHGRPVELTLSLADLAKQFKRT